MGNKPSSPSPSAVTKSTSKSGSSKTTGQGPVQKTITNKKMTSMEKFLLSIDRHSHTDRSRASTISEEIAAYGSLAKKYGGMNAIRFWKDHGNALPILKAKARYYLATPGTSVPSECAFSRSAYIGRKERSRLTPNNLSYSVFLKDKLQSTTPGWINVLKMSSRPNLSVWKHFLPFILVFFRFLYSFFMKNSFGGDARFQIGPFECIRIHIVFVGISMKTVLSFSWIWHAHRPWPSHVL